MADLAERVRTARSRVDREIGEARAVGEAGKRLEAEAADLQAQVELHDRVTALLTRTGEESQMRAQSQIEELVTRGLQVIFDTATSFHVINSERAGQAQADFVIRTAYPDGVVETPVLEARGGGMAAVTGFLLRLVVLLLRSDVRRILFLDETFGMVSAEYEPRVAEFLAEVAEKAGVQIVLITHSSAFADAADRSYRLALGPDGCTVVTTA